MKRNCVLATLLSLCLFSCGKMNEDSIASQTQMGAQDAALRFRSTTQVDPYAEIVGTYYRYGIHFIEANIVEAIKITPFTISHCALRVQVSPLTGSRVFLMDKPVDESYSFHENKINITQDPSIGKLNPTYLVDSVNKTLVEPGIQPEERERVYRSISPENLNFINKSGCGF